MIVRYDRVAAQVGGLRKSIIAVGVFAQAMKYLYYRGDVRICWHPDAAIDAFAVLAVDNDRFGGR